MIHVFYFNEFNFLCPYSNSNAWCDCIDDNFPLNKKTLLLLSIISRYNNFNNNNLSLFGAGIK